MKIMAMLAVDTLAIFRTRVIAVSEGGLAGETQEDIVPNIERNTESCLVFRYRKGICLLSSRQVILNCKSPANDGSANGRKPCR
jgi:hypothetical protein